MPINVGGDDSVKWKVDVSKAREAYSDPPPQPVPPPGKPYYHEGVDYTKDSPTDPGDAYDFTVVVEVPTYPNPGAGRAALEAGLSAALDAVRANKPRIYFRIPVQDREHGGPNEDQIRIRWARASGLNQRGGEYTDAVPD